MSQVLTRGCPHITSAARGGKGVGQILTIADGGGRGGTSNTDGGGVVSAKSLIKLAFNILLKKNFTLYLDSWQNLSNLPQLNVKQHTTSLRLPP